MAMATQVRVGLPIDPFPSRFSVSSGHITNTAAPPGMHGQPKIPHAVHDALRAIYDRVGALDSGNAATASQLANMYATHAGQSAGLAQQHAGTAAAATKTTLEVHTDAAGLNAKLDQVLGELQQLSQRVATVEQKPCLQCAVM